MTQISQYVLTHGAPLLFILILLEQAGLPLPIAPVLVAVGSLASFGHIGFAQALAAAFSACLLADGFWCAMGRSHRPQSGLALATTSNWKKRILELIGRHGLRALLPAKYIFSSNVLSLLAGRGGVPAVRFVAFDSIASVVWSGGYIALGYLLRYQVHWTLTHTLAPLVLLFCTAVIWFVSRLLPRGSNWPWPSFRRAQRSRDISQHLGGKDSGADEHFAARAVSPHLIKAGVLTFGASTPHYPGFGIRLRRAQLCLRSSREALFGVHTKPRRGSAASAIALLVLICPSSFAQQALPFVPDDSTGAAGASIAQLSSESRNEMQQSFEAEGAGSTSQNQERSGHDSTSATILGTVTDIEDAPVSDATVVLEAEDSGDVRRADTNDSGFFEIAAIPPGHPYRVTVNANGFEKWESSVILLQAGEFKILDVGKLPIEKVQTNITVKPEDSEQIATEQVKAEENQRGFLIIPNFYAVYSPNPEPLTAKLKFNLAFRVARDPFTLGGVTVLAGIGQAADSPKFVEGGWGYGERFAANYANAFTDIMLGGAILPAIFHQDPRYFYQGTGTKRSRTLHVISSLFVAKGDDGHWQPNYSSIGGDLASSAISNLYYPKSNRGIGLVLQGFAINTVVHLTVRVLDEFVFRPPRATPDSAPWNSNPHL
jgi:membrane protein DedA with SNARE-associated domain